MEVNVLNIKVKTRKKGYVKQIYLRSEPNDHAIYLDVKRFMTNDNATELINHQRKRNQRFYS